MSILLNNYLIDIYAILWCLYILFRTIKFEKARFITIWSITQIFLFGIDFLDKFLNKGYCIFESCEPTHTLRQYLNISFNGEESSLIRFISMTLMFVVIIKLHKVAEKHFQEKQL
jgi:hypothetical protein